MTQNTMVLDTTLHNETTTPKQTALNDKHQILPRQLPVSYDVVGHMLLLIHCGCTVIIYTNFVEVESPMLHDKHVAEISYLPICY